MKKHSLRTNLTLSIAFVVVLTVVSISLLSNFFIDRQFKAYITKQQEQRTDEIVSSLSQQYDQDTKIWNVDFLHTIGMNALYNGYIIKVYDVQNEPVWSAETQDMNMCSRVMNDISTRMKIKYPQVNGEFTAKNYDLTQGGVTVGGVNISYFGPYFLSENDFKFLDALNIILISIGAFSLIVSIVVGWFISKGVSKPILKTVNVAKQMSDGDYIVRIDEKTDTKELDELMSSINHLADSLGKQENLRKQLTADVAHELRTPLTTLGTHIEAMIEGVWSPTPERLTSCHEEIIRISKLVSDLESLVKIESDNLRLDKTLTNLLELITRVSDTFEVEISNKNLKLSIEGECSDIFIDRDRISQVLINLISNAVKYTHSGGTIWVTVSDTEKTVNLNIKDDGIGIPEKELPFIFERFYRTDKSRDRMTGGSGIGLAIVKSIINAHGGTVNVQSEPNQGSSFEIILPKNDFTPDSLNDSILQGNAGGYRNW